MAIDCLFVGLFHDYGRPEADVSHEYVNLWTGLAEHPRLSARAFHPDVEASLHGPEGMRERFRALVQARPPALLVHHPFTPELDVPLDAVADLTRRGVATVEWDADSSWRFDDFIRPRIGSYALFVTTGAEDAPRYVEAGARVHASQWAVSSRYRGFEPARARPVAVSFVGQAHGRRRDVVAALRRADVPVETWGRKWSKGRWFPDRRDHGYVPYAEALRAIGDSRVSLNLSAVSARGGGTQMKGRHFEIPGLGACQVTTPTDGVEAWFEPGTEIVVAEEGEALADAVRGLLAEPRRALAIAEAGFRRTWADHTWERRIDGLLAEIGLA
jgi:spore maturation protein CgeB